MVFRASTENLTPSHQEIATRAYHLWEQAGRPNGRDREHWLKAERQLLEIHKQEERALRHWEKARGLTPKKLHSRH